MPLYSMPKPANKNAARKPMGALPQSMQTLQQNRYQPGIPMESPQATRMVIPQIPGASQGAGPAIVPAAAQDPSVAATNEIAGIAQRLRALPTMADARRQAESTARANYMQEYNDVNSRLAQRNAGAIAGAGNPLLALQGQPQQAMASIPATPQQLQSPFAVPRYGQTETQAGQAYDAARGEGARRLNNTASRILSERGDNLGTSQVARVGLNSTLLKTPDGRINVIGNRQRQLISDSESAGQFQQAQANAIRSQATPTGSLILPGRNQQQVDARALRAQKLYGLPKSTPAVAAAMERSKAGVAGTGGLASITSGPQAAKALGQNAAKSDTWKFLQANPAADHPLDIQSKVLSATMAGQLGQKEWDEVRSDMKRRMLADPKMFDGGMLSPSTGRDARRKHWDDILDSKTPDEYLSKIGRKRV